LGPDFDMAEGLNRLADLAVQRALRLSADGKPRDLKALVETAEKAVGLAERLREMGLSRRSPEEAEKSVREMRALLHYIKKQKMDLLAAQGQPVQVHGVSGDTDEASDGGDGPTVH
jgi:hypothetical protein